MRYIACRDFIPTVAPHEKSVLGAVTVVLDGKPLQAYTAALEINGRVVAPLRPFVTAIADRLWFEGNVLVIARDGRMVRVPVASRGPDALNHAFLPVAHLLRELGARVDYDPRRHRLDVRTPGPQAPESPLPQAQSVTPRSVFTPAPVATPRPVWTGSPLPRRTPLPYATPRPTPPR